MSQKKKITKVVLTPDQQILGAVLVGMCPRCGRLLNWSLTADFPIRHTAFCCGQRFTSKSPVADGLA